MNNFKRLSCIFILLLCFCIVFSSCSGEKSAKTNKITINAAENMIDETGILATIEELSSDKYKGRLAGTEENELAAQYLVDHFKKIGLVSSPKLENYVQKYYTQVQIIKNEPVLQLEDKEGNVVKSFKYVENFVIRALSSQTQDIDIKAPLYKAEDMEAINTSKEDAKGKICLFSLSSRQNASTTEMVETVSQNEALAGIGEFDIKSEDRKHSNLTVTPFRGPWMRGSYNPYMLVDNDTFVELAQAADKGLYLRFICSFEEDFRKPVSNVIGLIEGSDPKLKNEYIIVGAHFDHVGDNKNGTYNSGALDNASGTAGLVEIARVIKSGKIQPKKSILFIAFNGEESGFTGSEYYVNNPVYPLDRAAMINMDMIGASKEMPITIASADKSGYGLQDEMYEYARALGIEARKGDMAGSDHYSFAQVGVASVMLIDEDWGNGYHSPNDNMEDISKTKIEQIVKLVLHYIDKNAY